MFFKISCVVRLICTRRNRKRRRIAAGICHFHVYSICSLVYERTWLIKWIAQIRVALFVMWERQATLSWKIIRRLCCQLTNHRRDASPLSSSYIRVRKAVSKNSAKRMRCEQKRCYRLLIADGDFTDKFWITRDTVDSENKHANEIEVAFVRSLMQKYWCFGNFRGHA